MQLIAKYFCYLVDYFPCNKVNENELNLLSGSTFLNSDYFDPFDDWFYNNEAFFGQKKNTVTFSSSLKKSYEKILLISPAPSLDDETDAVESPPISNLVVATLELIRHNEKNNKMVLAILTL